MPMRDSHLIGLSRRKRYAELRAGFAWDIPETFNFATDVVEAWAAERDGMALVTENASGGVRELRFSDIARAAARLADVLARAGLAKGDRVIVMLPRIAEWQIALVACLRLGAVPIPCIEMLTAKDIEYRVKNSGASAVICRGEMAEKLAAVRDAVPIRIAVGGAPGFADWEREIAAASESRPPARVGAEDPAIMYYTSGSTGHPKGVLHASRAIYTWRMSAYFWLDLEPADRIWCTADTGWSKAGTSIIWGPWSAGSCAFMYDGPFSPAERLRLLARHRITVYCAAGTELYRVVNEDVKRYDLSALRHAITAGEALSPVVARRFEEATGVKVAEAYGQTEALMMTLNFPSEPLKYGSMGLAAPGLDLDVIDDAGRRLPPDKEGHVAILTPCPQMMLGYWQDPERTAQCFIEGPEGRWYVSGDRASRDAEGYLWYAGRSDDVINSAGYRIGPLEVESVLLEHAAVQECAVVASPDAERGEIVKAFVVLREGQVGSPALAADLQAHAKAMTAPYKYPRAVEFVAELPKTVTGKIRRRELRDLETARAAARGNPGGGV